jgi:hypothetical protein
MSWLTAVCPGGHIARRSDKKRQNHRGAQVGMFDNLRAGPVPCVRASVEQHFGNSSKKAQ